MFRIDDAPQELADAIREFWPADQWDAAASIAQVESGWSWSALDDTTRGGSIPCGAAIGSVGGVPVTAEYSIGYFQINACNYPGWDRCHFYNVRQNAGTAHALWVERGWQPWLISARKLGLL